MDYANALADALRKLLKEYPLAGSPEWVEAERALTTYDAHPAEAATRENGDETLHREILADELSKLAKATNNPTIEREALALVAKTPGVTATPSCSGNSGIMAALPAMRRVAALSTHQQQGFPVVKVPGHIVNHMAWKDGALIVTVAHQQQGAESAAAYLLEDLQWEGGYDNNGRQLCPCCQSYAKAGHLADCRLMAVIASLSRPPQPDTVTDEDVHAAIKAVDDWGYPYRIPVGAMRAALAARGKPSS